MTIGNFNWFYIPCYFIHKIVIEKQKRKQDKKQSNLNGKCDDDSDDW